MLSRQNGAFCLVERDDLVLLVAKCLSGLAHFVILLATSSDACYPSYLETNSIL